MIRSILSKNQKRLIVIIVSLIVSAYIWHINRNVFGNTFHTCLNLSTTTFLIIFTPFEIYFSFRDLWFKRWIPLYLSDLEISEIKIQINTKTKEKKRYISADLIISKNKELVKSKNALIIISHGFSDTKRTLQYYYFPLAYNGYTILSYDARGIGKSKRVGKRSHFLKRIEDFKKIVDWIQSNKKFNKMEIYCVGFSIGAITVLCGGFPNQSIKKIVAISSMSYYKQNIPKYNPIVILSYLIKGVKIFPNKDENMKLSPYLTIKNVKSEVSSEDWRKFSQKVMLIHTRNDKIIKLRNFHQNRLILETLDKNQLLLSKGGHTQKKNELALVGATLNYFDA